MSWSYKVFAGAYALALLGVGAWTVHEASKPTPQPFSDPVHVTRAVSEQIGATYTVFGRLDPSTSCVPSEIAVTAVEGGFTASVTRYTSVPGYFDAGSCEIPGPVVLFTSKVDPAGQGVVVNGTLLTIEDS